MEIDAVNSPDGITSEQTKQDRFLQLMERHRGILFKAANAFCNDPEDRNDLIQEIVVQLWLSFDRFDERHRFSTWMYRVAMNVAISYYRRERRRPDKAESIDAIAMEIRIERDEDADDEVRLLHQLITGLDEINRALIILHLDGYDYDEIAGIIGMTSTNVSTRLNRIKQRLQRDYAALQQPKAEQK